MIRKNEQWVADKLRRSLIGNEFRSGERINESMIAERFGVSRTPVRGALRTLEAEGFIAKRTGRGFSVSGTKVGSLKEVIQLRSVMEGLAARTLAESGMSSETIERFQASLSATEQVARAGQTTPELLEAFQFANAIFHETLVRDCGNAAIVYAHDRLKTMPLYNTHFLAPSASDGNPSLLHLQVSHGQHAVIFRAMQDGDGARAEAMVREHANANTDYAELFLA